MARLLPHDSVGEPDELFTIRGDVASRDRRSGIHRCFGQKECGELRRIARIPCLRATNRNAFRARMGETFGRCATPAAHKLAEIIVYEVK